jgi:hypothetical protein
LSIWIFGDSYVEDYNLDYQWFRQMSKILDNPVKTVGHSGWSNDFISNQIYLHAINGDIKQDDFVIQIQTQYSRTWFFEDRPELSNFVHHVDPTAIGMTKDEKRATDQWLRYLYNPKSLIWQTYANSVASATLLMQNIGCKILTIPAFHNVLVPFNPYIGVNGTLTECISYLEYSDKNAYMAALTQPGGDPRINHMKEVNHGILAHKIADAITTTGHLDLTKDFEVREPVESDFTSPEEYRRYQLENAN